MYPPPPIADRKTNGKKIAERGGTPPPYGRYPWLGFLNPSLNPMTLSLKRAESNFLSIDLHEYLESHILCLCLLSACLDVHKSCFRVQPGRIGCEIQKKCSIQTKERGKSVFLVRGYWFWRWLGWETRRKERHRGDSFGSDFQKVPIVCNCKVSQILWRCRLPGP